MVICMDCSIAVGVRDYMHCDFRRLEGIRSDVASDIDAIRRFLQQRSSRKTFSILHSEQAATRRMPSAARWKLW